MYWDLINSDMNRRDVQTGCSGYVHKNTGDESVCVCVCVCVCMKDI